LAGDIDDDAAQDGSVVVLASDGERLATFEIEDRIRPGTGEVVRYLRRLGLPVEILSGDRPGPVEKLAAELGIGRTAAGLLPSDKLDHIRRFAEAGRKALMVGDGLNDAPALAAAYVSMAPATAADIGRSAADFVFLHEDFSAASTALDIARKAKSLVRENFVLAVVYNALAVPVAVSGLVTPLLAAVAMSLSSVLVVANAMRLRPAPVSQREERQHVSAQTPIAVVVGR
jgi:Cu2+-exporting ATPase